MNRHIKNLTLSGMFLAIGLILPLLTGLIQQIGNMLLPMHIPVLLCGLICGWQYGGAVGLIMPFLRNLLFGMPPMPNAISMAFELAANKAHVCFIGTPHVDLAFTPEMWENMNRKEFHLTGSWMSYSAPFPGKEWELTAHYFATGQLKFDPGFIYKKVPMSQAQEAFQMFKTPGLVKGKVLLVNES